MSATTPAPPAKKGKFVSSSNTSTTTSAANGKFKSYSNYKKRGRDTNCKSHWSNSNTGSDDIKVEKTCLDQDITKLIDKLNSSLEEKSSNKVKIIIDNRENKNVDLVNIFQRLDRVLVETKTLLCGDFIILLNEKTGLVFERKRLSDLSSSIKSGHLREQTNNMTLLFPEFNGQFWRSILLVEKEVTHADTKCTIQSEKTNQFDENGTDILIDIQRIENQKDVDLKRSHVCDDLWWLVGDEKQMDVVPSLDRTTLIGASVNRHVKFGMGTIMTESDKYTAFVMLKYMVCVLENADYLSRFWNLKSQQPFTITSVKDIANLLTGEQLKEYVASRESPKLKESDVPAGLKLSKASQLFAQNLISVNGITKEVAFSILEKFPTPKIYAKYMIEHESNPQKVVDDLARIIPNINLMKDSDTKKPNRIGPKKIITLFNNFHDTNHDAKAGAKKDVVVLEK